MKAQLFLTIFLSLLLEGCRNAPPTSPEQDLSGRFSLSRISQLHKEQGSTLSVDYDLGEIQNTTTFFFLLTNTGHRNITDISLLSSNPKIKITPALIDTLPPADRSEFTPLIQITAIHGTPQSNIGYTDLMTPGINIDTLTISGKTKNNDDTERDEILKPSFQLFALVADITVTDGNMKIDLGNKSGTITPTDLPFGNFWVYSVTQPYFSIMNSGNVDIQMNAYSTNGDSIRSRILHPAETDSLPKYSFVIIDTFGTITDRRVLYLDEDGKLYFYFAD